MLNKFIYFVCFFFLAVPAMKTASALPAEVIDLTTIKPDQCPEPYKFDESLKKCFVKDDVLKKITSAAGCPASIGLTWNESSKSCDKDAGKEPAPSCGSKLPDLAVKDGKCVVQREIPRSSLGNYLGDCFWIRAAPTNNSLGIGKDDRLVVMWEQEEGKDKLLTVSRGYSSFLFYPFDYFCKPQGPQFTVRSSDLEALGATRMGWTYGVLTMPFKYFRHDRSFSSQINIGPYIGRRSGTAGSATTFAVSASIGSAKGEVKDGAGNITGSADLVAYSIAAGWMWDISKAPNLKPFKIGLFVGQDRVSKDNAVSYKNNGKGWLAFQIGFDFTD